MGNGKTSPGTSIRQGLKSLAGQEKSTKVDRTVATSGRVSVRFSGLRLLSRRLKSPASLAAHALLIFLFFAVTISLPPPAHTQGPCGTVDSIGFPLDPSSFEVVYGFGVPSARHDARFHTGEDWTGPRLSTYGSPVQAIARGRVTYSAPTGWGRDKGVVIVEHTMPDGSRWFSLYGHMEEVAPYTFPAVYSCVEQGTIVGAVGRARPAPHVHLEIRNFGQDSPGAGYAYTDPGTNGWENPSRFILNWQARLHPAYRWHTDLTSDSGPRFHDLLRSDGTLITLDGDRLIGIHPNGGVLWRYNLDTTLNPMGMIAYGEDVLIAGQNGALQLWNASGPVDLTWQLPHGIDAPPILWADLLIIHAPDGNLIAYGPDRAERWRVPGVASPAEMQASGSLLAITTQSGDFLLIGTDGAIFGEEALRGAGSLVSAPDGGFYVRSQTGLWRVSSQNEWQLLVDTPTPSPETDGLFTTPDSHLFLYGGATDSTLYAYSVDGSPLWTAPIPNFQGSAALFTDGGGALLLADGYGHVQLVGKDSGALCSALRVWGWRASNVSADLGSDGVLRLHVADQVIGLDWATLAAGCR